jgi:hypothetical protein
MKLPQQSSSPTIFHGGRFSRAIKAGRTWQVRVPMGGTVHRDRGNTRRSLSTTRQENEKRREQPMECRATTAVLRIGELWRQETFEIWPSEPRTWGHRSGSLGQLDNMNAYFSFHSGAQTLQSYEVKINKVIEIWYLWLFEIYC